MFKDVFNDIIKQKNLSLYKVAKDTKIPKTIVYDWAAGARQPVSEYIVTLADYLECSVDFLLGRDNQTEIKPASHMLKVASPDIKQPLFSKKSLIEDIIYEKPIDINSHVSIDEITGSGDDFWITVCDGSMEGEHIFKNTEVLIRRDVKAKNGDIAAVLIKGKEIMLRRFFKDGDEVVLEAANPSCVPMELKADDVTVLGRAVEIKTMI